MARRGTYKKPKRPQNSKQRPPQHQQHTGQKRKRTEHEVVEAVEEHQVVENTQTQQEREQEEQQLLQQISHQPKSYMHHISIQDFYNVYAVKRMAFNFDQSLLAVSRLNSEIEIWATPQRVENKFQFTLVKKIPAKANTTVEALVWMKSKRSGELDRLFSAGLHGQITEWDLSTCLPKNISGTYGGAIWGLSIHEQSIAAAHEDGKVRIYNSDLLMKQSFGPSQAETIPSVKKLQHCKGHRLLAITYDRKDGKYIYVGGLTGVYCFEVSTGAMKYKITLQNSICMSLLHLRSDHVLVVGDSAGTTLFCDAKFGTVISKQERHVADIHQIVATSDEKYVFVTGSDSKISLFQRGRGNNNWVHTHGHRPSHHDLFALVVFKDDCVLAGGIDSKIYELKIETYFKSLRTRHDEFSLLTDKDIAKVTTTTHVVISQDNEEEQEVRLLYIFDNHNGISIVRLPNTPLDFMQSSESESTTTNKNKRVKYEDTESYKVQNNVLMQLVAKSPGGWNMTSFDVSADGRYICCTGPDFVIVFQLVVKFSKEQGVELEVTEKRLLRDVTPGLYCAFVDNTTVCVASRTNASLQFYDLQKKSLKRLIELSTINTPTTTTTTTADAASYFSQSITGLTVVDKNFVVVSRGNQLDVYNYSNNSSHAPAWTIQSDSMIYKIGVLNKEQFYTLSVHNKYGIYNPSDMSVVDTGALTNVMKLFGGARGMIQGQSGKVHAYNTNVLFSKDRTDLQGLPDYGFKMFRNQHPIMSILKLNDQEFLQLTVDWVDLFVHMIGVIYRKRFGA